MFLCVCVCSRGDGLDFIPKLSSCGLIDTRSKYLRFDNEAPCELRCLPVYRCPEATGQLGVLYLQYLSMYTVSNQKTVGGGVWQGKKLTYCTDELPSVFVGTL